MRGNIDDVNFPENSGYIVRPLRITDNVATLNDKLSDIGRSAILTVTVNRSKTSLV